MKTLKRWLRRLRSGSTVANPRSPQRQLADEARDRRDWRVAAEHYGEHLKLFPADFGIWVQRGHMMKEAGRFADADHAYDQALRLKGRDTDLLLHYAHLKKLRHDWPAAAALYVRGARVGLTPALIAELGAPAIVPHVDADLLRRIDAMVGAAISERCGGVTMLASSQVTPHGDGRFGVVSHASWIKFRLDWRGAADTGLGELELRVAPGAEGQPLSGRLYLDYGDDYRDHHSVPLARTEPGAPLVIALAAPKLIRSIRWAPDDKANLLAFQSLEFRPGIQAEAALERFRDAWPPEIDLSLDLEDIRTLLQKPGPTPTEATRVTRLLASSPSDDTLDYDTWLRRWVTPTPDDYPVIAEMTAKMARRPTFSFVMPVYNTPLALLAECLDSMLGQTYSDFEICIADDNSPDPKVWELLERYAARDARIKIVRRRHNGHISAATNTALALATGEFVVLMDHDDLLPDYALFMVALYLNRHPDAQILYSDEDKITVDGERFAPYFKGDFDPYLLYGHNMVSHLGVYRRDLMEALGGLRLCFEGSQDHDLVLRAFERVGEAAVVHIPHVLYHWRAIPGSTAVSVDEKSYAIQASRNAINGHFDRRDMTLRCVLGFADGAHRIGCTLVYDTPVSIIIPTRDGLEDLTACINSILRADHSNTEIIVIDNGSSEAATLRYLAELEAGGVAVVIRDPSPFNFPDLNNRAAARATGQILCFLNNDTEVVSSDWLARARALLAIPEIGVVGARLLYPDGTLQHFGVVTGMAAHKVAGTPHVGQPAEWGGYFSKARLLQQFSAVTAACMFVKAEAFRAVGGYEPALRVAYNDVDLCLKIGEAGYKIVADPDLVLIHKESKTRGADTHGDNARRLDAEARIMRDRWAERLDRDPFYSPNHDLEHNDFRLASPPRSPVPWRDAAAKPASRAKPGRRAPRRAPTKTET